MQANGRTEVAREQTKIILGPWNHAGLGSRKSGDIDYRPQVQVESTTLSSAGSTIESRYFVMGSCEWKRASTWPPPGHGERNLFLADGALEREPASETASDDYVYDPRDPVPTLWSRALFAGVSDRSKLDYRQDILRYRTEPLAEELEIAGDAEVILNWLFAHAEQKSVHKAHGPLVFKHGRE